MHARAQGMLRGEELSQAYASADVFMMPSETETLGFVALEAMASGLPVVAVAAGGLVDIVTKPGVIGASRWRWCMATLTAMWRPVDSLLSVVPGRAMAPAACML